LTWIDSDRAIEVTFPRTIQWIITIRDLPHPPDHARGHRTCTWRIVRDKPLETAGGFGGNITKHHPDIDHNHINFKGSYTLTALRTFHYRTAHAIPWTVLIIDYFKGSFAMKH